MKWILIILLWDNGAIESVHTHSVEFESIKMCHRARDILEIRLEGTKIDFILECVEI